MKKMGIERVRTMNYRKFYALLGRLPGAEKGELALQFTAGRTDSLAAMRPEEYFSMLGAMEATVRGEGDRYAAMDKLRKRLIACIGGYLTAMGRNGNIELIKALACRASGHGKFNDIPPDRLKSLYNAFLKRQKDIKAAGEVSPDAPVRELEARLAAAVRGEQYELAAGLQERINFLSTDYTD
ncbi:MAG: hypothetical protein LBB79_08400 [Prevotellaceae bacterium]|jgi:hypothetical protein|nr:hypothetical protein [Prevotellaceae bacterium]